MKTMTKEQLYLEAYRTTASVRKSNVEKRAKRFGLSVERIRELHSRKSVSVSNQLTNASENKLNIEDAEKRRLAELFVKGDISYQEFKDMLLGSSKQAENGMLKADDYNWIFIGDIHEPFSDPRYFDFVCNFVEKYKVNKVIFLGDEIDNHAISYHEKDPNGYGVKQEYDLAVLGLKKWYDRFPNADVMVGNHTGLIKRQVKSAGLLNEWIKPMNEIFNVPTWKYHTEFETDKFVCGHGDDGKNLKTKVLNWGKSYIQGHYHSDSSLMYVSEGIFGMQVGCGVDKDSYAFRYAGKGAKRFIHSVGGYIDGDPILATMKKVQRVL